MEEKKRPYRIQLKDIHLDEVEISVLDGVEIEVKRIYTIRSKEKPSIRGNHAHFNQVQLLRLLHGKARLILTNKAGERFHFDLGKDYIYIPCMHWIELLLEPESNVLCLASKEYKDLKSTSNKEEFLTK